MRNVSRLETAISELSECKRIHEAKEKADRCEDLYKIRAAEKLTASLGQSAAAPSRTRSVLEEDTDALDGCGSGQPCPSVGAAINAVLDPVKIYHPNKK